MIALILISSLVGGAATDIFPYQMKFSDRRKTSQSAFSGPSSMVSSKEYVLKDQPSLNGMAMSVDGTMYLVAADAKLICVSPNGTVNWTFRPTGLPAIWVLLFEK